MAHFQAILHVPATHPLQFSRVVIAVKQGATAETVTSGLTFEPPMTLAEAPLRFTVPQVFSFCAARPELPYLGYGVAVRGYVRGVFTGGAGPAQFVVLAHSDATTISLTLLARRHEGLAAHGDPLATDLRLSQRRGPRLPGIRHGAGLDNYPGVPTRTPLGR